MSSSDSNKLKDKKFGAKHLIIALLVLFVGIPLLMTAITGSGNNEANPASPNQTQKQKKTSSQKKNEVKPVSYEIINTKDTSIKALGDKALSDFTTQEIQNLPKDERRLYRVVVGTEISKEQVRPTVEKVISDITGENPDIDEITLDLYSTKDRAKGTGYDIAQADWSTGGEIGGITPKIARRNMRDDYEVEINIRKDNLEKYLEKISQEPKTKFGLTEAERKELQKKLVHCEDKADIQASKYYDPMCSSCSEFVEDNFDKLSEKTNEISEECKQGVRKEYGITEEAEDKIITEAINKSWPSPEVPSYPDCCDY